MAQKLTCPGKCGRGISKDKIKKILCVGMCILDIIHIIDKYPQEDLKSRATAGRWQRGGNASNNCTVLSLLGAKCEYLGTFSNDDMFKFVINNCSKYDISIKNCKYYDNVQAPLSSIILVKGTRTIIHSNPDLLPLTYNDFKKCNLNEYNWIHFEAAASSETIQMMESVYLYNQKLTEKDAHNKITISLDLELAEMDNLSLVKYAEYVILAKDFATFINCTNRKDAVHELRKLTNEGCTIICPWGTEGIAVLDKSNSYAEYSAFTQTDVKDTLGAGDTFCAAIIYALSKNYELSIAMKFASTITGIKVGSYGYDVIKTKFNGNIDEFLQSYK